MTSWTCSFLSGLKSALLNVMFLVNLPLYLYDGSYLFLAAVLFSTNTRFICIRLRVHGYLFWYCVTLSLCDQLFYLFLAHCRFGILFCILVRDHLKYQIPKGCIGRWFFYYIKLLFGMCDATSTAQSHGISGWWKDEGVNGSQVPFHLRCSEARVKTCKTITHFVLLIRYPFSRLLDKNVSNPDGITWCSLLPLPRRRVTSGRERAAQPARSEGPIHISLILKFLNSTWIKITS